MPYLWEKPIIHDIVDYESFYGMKKHDITLNPCEKPSEMSVNLLGMQVPWVSVFHPLGEKTKRHKSPVNTGFS